MRTARKTKRAYPTLLAWREAAGINQRQAAQLLGISQSCYARLERGARYASGPLARQIRQTVEVPLDVLVGAA